MSFIHIRKGMCKYQITHPLLYYIIKALKIEHCSDRYRPYFRPFLRLEDAEW